MLTFFGFSQKHLKILETNIFYLIKSGGWSLDIIYDLPIHDFYRYIELLNEDNDKRKKAMDEASSKSGKKPVVPSLEKLRS